MTKYKTFDFMDAIMESDLPASARHIYMVIAKRYNEATGYAFPSFPRLSKDTGYSVSTCKRAVNEVLVPLGWLTKRSGGKGRANQYIPTIGTSVTMTPSSVTMTLPQCHHDTTPVSPRHPNGQENGQENGQLKDKEEKAFSLRSNAKVKESRTTATTDLNNVPEVFEDVEPITDCYKEPVPDVFKTGAARSEANRKAIDAAMADNPDYLYAKCLKRLEGREKATQVFIRRLGGKRNGEEIRAAYKLASMTMEKV